MTLPQNPKIGDIITELQDLTLINQKAELAGVIGSPTTTTSNVQEYVETIQDAKDIIADKFDNLQNTDSLLDIANSVYPGRRMMIVSYTSTSSTGNVVVATNLDFEPRVVICVSNNSNYTTVQFKLPSADGSVISNHIVRNPSNATLGEAFFTRESVNVRLNSTGDWLIYIFE